MLALYVYMHPRKQELKPFKKFKNLTFIKTINTLGQLHSFIHSKIFAEHLLHAGSVLYVKNSEMNKTIKTSY